jgi:hypothetical protein
MRTRRLADERGMALAVAIFALVVIGALVAAAFYAGNLEQRTGRSTIYSAAAAEAAEAGAAAVLGDWTSYQFNNMAVADSTSLGKTTLAGNAYYSTMVTRLNQDLFLIRSLGARYDASGGVLAERAVGTLARLRYVKATAQAAVTVTKHIQFKGTSFIVNGQDSTPTGWAATDPSCTTAANQAGIRSDTASGATSKDKKNVFGAPPMVENDPTVNSDFFNVFGDVTFDELKTQADIVVSDDTPQMPEPTLTGTPQRCNISDMNNWGEPRRAPDVYIEKCINYFPIIYASGSQLKLAAGARGQGLLLVEGDIEIVGNFEFAGMIVAKGGMKMAGTGNKITGALLAQTVNLDDANEIAGNTTLQFSSCALDKAIKGSAKAEPLSYRSWMQLY